MKTIRAEAIKAWRRPTGWIAAYALVLHLLVSAFAGAQFSAQAAGHNWSFFEICYGQGASNGEAPGGTPSKHASKSYGCAVCANAAAAAAPEAPSISPVRFSVSLIEWSSRDNVAARAEVSFSQRQRAPPFAA